MKTSLSLTDDQAVRMEDANKQFRTRIQVARKNGKTDKAEFKKIKDEHEVAVKSILSEDQYQKWLTFRTEKKNQGKGKHNRKK